jgi:hypothetical protein
VNNPLRVNNSYLLMGRLHDRAKGLASMFNNILKIQLIEIRSINEILTNLNTFSKSKVKTPPMDQVILKHPHGYNHN